MKCTCCDKQNMIRLYLSIFCINGTAFNYGKQISLHSFMTHICASHVSAFNNFINFIYEYDAFLLCFIKCLTVQGIGINQLLSFLSLKDSERILDFHPAFLCFCRPVGAQHFREIYADGPDLSIVKSSEWTDVLLYVYFNLTFVQLPVHEHVADPLSCPFMYSFFVCI